MKKKLIIILFALLTVSCNQKKETPYTETKLPNGYILRLPSDFKEIRQGLWKTSGRSYLEINSTNGISKDLKNEFEYFSSSRDSEDLYKEKKLIRTENVDENGLNGFISYYENGIKGKGAGLVTLKTYIVFSIVQDDNIRFQINSMALNDNNFDEIAKSIKSISLDSKNQIIPFANKFDKNKAIEEGYQVFQDEGFIVKCNGKIKLDKLRIQQMKQSGLVDNTKPYHVFHKGTDYNINVSRYDQDLFGQSQKEIANYNKNDLDYYQSKFDEMSIKNKRGKYKNYDAVYYENAQNGRLTKAVFFHYKMKSYMLQVTDDNNVETKFQEFIKSFELIN